MGSEFISEVMDSAGLGIKVRILGSVRRETLGAIGEARANEAILLYYLGDPHTPTGHRHVA